MMSNAGIFAAMVLMSVEQSLLGVNRNDYENKDLCKAVKKTSLLSVIDEFGWGDVIIFHDSCTEHALPREDNRVKFIMYNTDNINETCIDCIFETLFHGMARRNVTFIVMANEDSTTFIIKDVVVWSRRNRHNHIILLYCKWLIFTAKNWQLFPYDFLNELNNFVIFEYSEENNQPYVSALSWHSEDGETLLWRGRSTDNVSLVGDPFPNQRYGLNGMTLTVIIKPFSNYVLKRTENGTDVYSGLCIDILRILADKLNFTYQLTEPQDGEFGVLNNGQWTGMVGEVHKGNVDIAMGPLAIEANRASAVDFSVPYSFEKTVMTYRFPIVSVQGSGMVLTPLHWLVYLLVASSALLVTLLYYIIENLSNLENLRIRKRRSRTTWIDALFIVNKGLFKQADDTHHTSFSSRTMLAFWWIFCLIITTTYSSNLEALLSTTKDTKPFSGLEELVELESFRWGVLGGSFVANVFEFSKNDVLTKAWERAISFSKSDPDIFSKHVTVLYDKMISSSFVYIGGKTAISTAAHNRCDVVYLEDYNLPYLSLSVAVQKGSPLKTLISASIQNMYEAGIIAKLESEWLSSFGCREPEIFKKQPVTLLTLEIAFYILLGGTAMSMLLLCIEVILGRRHLCKH